MRDWINAVLLAIGFFAAIGGVAYLLVNYWWAVGTLVVLLVIAAFVLVAYAMHGELRRGK